MFSLPVLRAMHTIALAISLPVSAMARPAFGAQQSDAGVVDIVKPDAARPDAGKPDAATAPPRPAAAGDASAKPGMPTDPKARKTFDEAVAWEMRRMHEPAVESYRKANKQDGGHCAECLRRAYSIALKYGEFKESEDTAHEMLVQATTDVDRALAHYRAAIAWQRQGVAERKDKCFSESCDEFKTALGLAPGLSPVHYALGVSLAHLHQDDAARKEFSAYLDADKDDAATRERAARYREHVDLARATMAPPFMLTTLDGRSITMDGLAGKVVLIDFWATWCGPCREALPHIRAIAHRFDGQPLVVLSISLDKDDGKWRDFVAKNQMTWMQSRDGGSTGSIARQFGVSSIPATFTIDAEGVLEDQHVGDADIEAKLKKLIARAVEINNRKPAPAVEDAAAGGDN